MKIGLFGGTFDPIHWGHLRSAEEAREAFGLDRVLFIPAAEPPHKRQGAATPARDRASMVRLAIASHPGFRLSEVEIARGGRSYTIETLRYFRRYQPHHAYYFIIGLDAFAEIGSWKEYEQLFPLSHFIVTSRPGADSGRFGRLPVALRRLFCYDRKKKAYRHASGTYVFFLKLTDIAISASDIRRRMRAGSSIRYLVPPYVDRYTRRQRLYRD
jgi:nicotinate-nucleotide adenylyltransferase